MINLQGLWNSEEGLEHDAEIGRGYVADVHGAEPQHLGGQQHLQDAIRQAAVKVRFPFVQLCAHGVGVVRARVAEDEHMDRRMAEVDTGIHASALAARRLLDFDLVAHLSLEDLHDLFANLRVSYDKEFPGLRVSSRGSPSRRFQDLFNKFIWDWLVPQEPGANAAAPLKHPQKGVNRFGAVRNWKPTRFFRSHGSRSSSSLHSSANAGADRSERSPVVEDDAVIAADYAQLLPQIGQIHRNRLRSHLAIKLDQHFTMRRLVADLDDTLKRPVGLNRPARAVDGPQRILETFGIACLFSNLDVRQEAEHRAPPVSPAPGMRVIEPLVACCRQPLRHAIHHLAPHALGSQSSNLSSGNRLHIGRYPFFDPMMTFLYRWKTEVNHLVGQDPIVVEIALSDMLTHGHPASGSGFAETHAVGKASASGKNKSDLGMRHGEPAEVRRRRSRGLHHPVEQGFLADIECVGIEGDLDGALPDFKARRRFRGARDGRHPGPASSAKQTP